MARGGARPGAGRPPGPQRRITDYWGEDAINEFFEFLRDNYKEDSRLMVWVGDHLLGKAPQSIDHTTLGKELPTPILNALPDEPTHG